VPSPRAPEVNIPPSAHESYKSLKRFKLVDEFADSEINASFGKTVDAFSHEQQKQNPRRVAVGRKPENVRQWQFTMTLGIIHRTNARVSRSSLSPPIMNVRATTLQNSATRHIEARREH
jgi:hypothetical protein